VPSLCVGNYRDLAAYRLASSIAAAVHAAAAAWPPFEKWTIGTQLVRAAGSIGANIAEAEGRFHRKDRQRLLFIARGSLNETRHWLELAMQRGLQTNCDGEGLDRLGRLLNGLIRNAERLEQ
jgi:four helix bundle protein